MTFASVPSGAAFLAAALVAAPAACASPSVERHEPRILVEAPSEVVAGERATFSVLLQDEWGREGPWLPTAGVERAMRLEIATTDSAAEVEPRILLEREDRGRRRAGIVFRTPGRHRIVVDGDAGIAGRSNPVRVLAEPPAERVYWGDLHGHLHTPGAGHSGPLDLDEYARLFDEAFAFARDASRLDFGAFTEHLQTAGGLATPGPGGRTPWDVALAAVEAAHVPGEFVAFPGFEWQGDEGDHCVIYPAPGPLDAPADYRALLASVRERGALLTAHAVFLPRTFDDAPPELAALEVTRDSKSTEWFGKDALAAGVVRPFLGCSDTHGGALGATSLTGLRAAALDREAILAAIGAGRTWATNGERIVLDFAADAGADVPRLTVRGVGTAPIDRVEILRAGRPVAEARGFPDREEFEFVWEDDDLLRPECLAGPVAYHARVEQTSANRYDPGARDLAISSPVQVTITPRRIDAAHARRGGSRETAPGAALELVRAAWDRMRAAPGRPLCAGSGAALPAWRAADVTALRGAVRAFERLAARDTTLVPLARTLGALPDVAAAIVQAADVEARLADVHATGPPGGARLAALRADVERVRVAVEKVEVRLAGADRASLDRAWFAPRALESARTRIVAALETLALLPERPHPVARGGAGPVARVVVPVDPRLAIEVGAIEARAAELHALHETAWGYTSRSSPPGAAEPAMRVRVVAEGNPRGARLVGGGIVRDAFVPFEPARNGWVAVLDRHEVPIAGEPALAIELDPPAVVTSVFVEGPRGAPLQRHGRVGRLDLRRGGDAVRVVVRVDDAPVSAELVARRHDVAGDRILWSGVLAAGERTLAFPADSLGDPAAVRLRWGFAGWRRTAAIEVPGHDVARPHGFGALADGRAVLALEDAVVLADPVSRALERRPLPGDVRLERGREFCAAPCAAGTVLRGADGSRGGWALLLSSTGEWGRVPPGPEAGTVVSDGRGGIAWLVGAELHRRAADGTEPPPRRLDAAGRLLVLDPAGRALVRIGSGEIVRADPTDGRIVERVPGPTVGVDASGAVLALEGLDRRHAELATGVRLIRHPGDGSRSAALPLAVKPSPILSPPVLAAAAPDGSLLVLGGTIGWRRGPRHDWWGVQVERWEPIWVGEARP